MSAVEFAAALAAVVLIVVYAGVAYTDFRFHAPVLVQYPLISIRNAGSIDIALIAFVSQT